MVPCRPYLSACAWLISLTLLPTLVFQLCECVRLPDSSDAFEQLEDGVKVTQRGFLKGSRKFFDDTMSGFQPLIIDTAREQLIVGARDMVIRLDSTSLVPIEKLHLPAPESKRALCQMKGHKKEDCHNFIRTLVLYEDKLLICGTNAFSPDCTWRKADDLSTKIGSDFTGVGVAPYSPHYNGTYLITKDGQLFTGVSTDTSGIDSSILRILPSNQLLMTDKANERWLYEPNFIHSMEYGNFIYFFFRETALESQCGASSTLSRVARVCKNDIGGDVILKKSWTTFNKATLTCSHQGRRFDLLQSVDSIPNTDLVAAVFTTDPANKNRLPGSALCIYDLSDFRTVFSGQFLYQTTDKSWVRHPNNYKYFDCEVQGIETNRPGLTKRPLVDGQRYQLMADHIQPLNEQTSHTADFEWYSKVTADRVRVKNGMTTTVFVSTTGGILKKLSFPIGSTKEGAGKEVATDYTSACLVEALQVEQPNKKFSSTQLRVMGDQLFLSTSDSLYRTPLERCSRFVTKQPCLDANDPYCGWNEKINECTTAPGGVTSRHFWEQKLSGECHKLSDSPVDGAWGPWMGWKECPRLENYHGRDVDVEECLCRTRACDRPKPRLGGANCIGSGIQVANCTVHGRWTQWSDWSACSATCGVSSKTRRRACSNPEPQYGGRTCVGDSTENHVCKLDECPVERLPPVHGGWSGWAGWSQCSKRCDGGSQKRVRQCNDPLPSNGGMSCSGCDMDYRACNTEPCEEIRRWSEWTPWMTLANSTKKGDGVTLKRFKFACGARIDDPRLVSVSRASEQEKYCHAGGNDCTDTGYAAVDGGWSAWTDWSTCSMSCGNGTQSRLRTCTDPSPVGSGSDCEGHAKEARQCNAHSCFASWSCWSDFTACSATCGKGIKQRTRECDRSFGIDQCEGERVHTLPCEMGHCAKDGYGTWSGWSSCSELGAKVRIRPCLTEKYCDGLPDAQMKPCKRGEGHDDTSAAFDYSTSSADDSDMSTNSYFLLVFAIIASFCLGCLLSLILACYAVRNNSNCCYAIGNKKHKGATQPNITLLQPTIASSDQLADLPLRVSTPLTKSTNIYTPPPSGMAIMRNGYSTLGRLPNGYNHNNIKNNNNNIHKRGSTSVCSSDLLGLEGKTYARYDQNDLLDESLFDTASVRTSRSTNRTVSRMRTSLNNNDYL